MDSKILQKNTQNKGMRSMSDLHGQSQPGLRKGSNHGMVSHQDGQEKQFMSLNDHIKNVSASYTRRSNNERSDSKLDNRSMSPKQFNSVSVLQPLRGSLPDRNGASIKSKRGVNNQSLKDLLLQQ